MNASIAEFENLKVSALHKVKIVNAYVQDVTIGPNASIKQSQKNTDTFTQKELQTKVILPQDALPSKRNTIQKLRAELEAQIQDEVQNSVKFRFQKVQAASNRFINEAKLAWTKKQEMLIEQSLKQEETVFKILREYDKKADNNLHQLELEYQRQTEERLKRNLEVQQRQQQLALVESIQKEQHTFFLIYQEIIGFLNSYGDLHASKNLSNNYVMLKPLLESVDAVREKCKTGLVTTTDLEQIRVIVAEATKLKENTHREILILKRQAEEKKLQENKVNTVNVNQSKQEIISPASPGSIVTEETDNSDASLNIAKSNDTNKESSSLVETFTNKSSFEMYMKLQQFLQNFMKGYEELLKDPNLKSFRFSCKKAVNIPLNSISSISVHHLTAKYQSLHNLLRGNTVDVAGIKITCSQHPQGLAYCTDLLAKKFVGQSDLITSESIHCYAAILVALWFDYPDFGKLILIHFYEAVPYLVPVYPPKLKGQTEEEYYKSLGYIYINGVREQQDKFLSRMSEYMRLYAAISITKLKKGQRGPHPHGLSWAWRWLANFLNLEPRVNITATLIFAFLEVAGNVLQSAYGIQFQKILKFLNEVYLPKIQKIDSGGPISRLEIFLQKIMKTGYIEPSKGRLPEGVW